MAHALDAFRPQQVLGVFQKGVRQVVQLGVKPVAPVQLLAQCAHPVDEPVGTPGQNLLLQLGGPLLQLLDVGQAVLNQGGEQVHQKIPRAALIVGAHGQHLGQKRGAGLLRGQQ